MTENGNGNAARREAIRSIIRTHRVGTQEEIRRELARVGIEATQATISRDLARLKARRVSLPEGGTAYELDEVPVSEGEAAVAAVKDLVTAVNESEALVVVNTLPGAASAVCVQMDRARVQGVLGTIAGDDTIFVAPARGVSPNKLSRKLKTLWGKA
ncbi:MAG TPA: arginine repressor [Myxococcaceae bacterium]|nr:arginine repressor [Myxococcaceae bacterium]